MLIFIEHIGNALKILSALILWRGPQNVFCIKTGDFFPDLHSLKDSYGWMHMFSTFIEPSPKVKSFLNCPRPPNIAAKVCHISIFLSDLGGLTEIRRDTP